MIKAQETLSMKDKYRMSQVLVGEKVLDVVGNKSGDAIIIFESGCSFVITGNGYLHVSEQVETRQKVTDAICESEAVFGGLMRKK
jgi:hypothetical protein